MAGFRTAFTGFGLNDDVMVSRLGKRITIKGRDGTFTDSDSAEANLLYEILKELRKGKK